MKIYIDNKLADIDDRSAVSISLSVASLTEIDVSRTGYSKTISIPMTERNREIMGDSEQINSPSMFNQQRHTARIEAQGCTVIEGVPYLISCSIAGTTESPNTERHYKISIIGSGKEWVKHANQTPFRNIGIDYSQLITPMMIIRSWSGDYPVRFLPVQRDKFAVQNIAQNIFPPMKVLTFEDYHPFLHLKSVVTKVFEGAGYQVCSDFMQSEYFNSLYMSGNYPKRNVDSIRTRMDFKAGRFADVSATADNDGRVWADPNRLYNTIGNLVDTADPLENVNGVTLDGVYTNSGLFVKKGKRVAFAPETEVMLGVEYSLRYTTDYYVANREELKGFNAINLEDGQVREYKLTNRFVDRRGEFRYNRTYTLILFGFNANHRYKFMYDRITNPDADIENLSPSDYETIWYSTIWHRQDIISVSTQARTINPHILIKPEGKSEYVLYTGDWVLYDGYIKERGEVDVEVTIRGGAERILPSNPKYFDLVFFGGAEPGMKLTLRKESTIKAIFAEYPAEGSTISFNQVAAHEISSLEVINAVKHLFNLWFYTDSLTRRVYIEPRSSFYRDDVVVDWSAKVDFGMPIVASELGADMVETIAMEYQRGDGAVSRWNEQNMETMGRWRGYITNNFAKEGERSYKNPIFTASLNSAGEFPDALAASMMQAGDRDKSGVESSGELNFSPKIVHYLGMVPLPKGQSWGWPLNGNKYPLVAFHNAVDNPSGSNNPLDYPTLSVAEMCESGISLCFEERDGLHGLHSFYDDNIALYNHGKRVELYLTLTPQDVEPIIHPNNSRQDFRALFRLTIDGESALYRLEQICDYNPTSNRATRCIFIKAPKGV